MAKSDSVDLRIIPHSERTPELEDKVKYWMGVTYDLPRNEKRIQRAKDPDSRDPMEIKTFRREEIRRIKNGAFGMCGKMYFFYNYVKMTDVEKGLIRPTYRVAQNEWFKQIEEAQKSKKYGLICVKRRRVGASWLEAADVLHDAITNPNLKFGMTSKSADDSVSLFEKVKFIYDNLPEWLRPATTAGRSRTRMDFSYYEKDTKGSLVKKGTQSEIVVKPPTDIAWEGFALSKLVIDEAGKIPNLRQLYAYAEPTLKKGFIRVGTPVIFGTAGDIGKEGAELMNMWYNSDAYDFKQFFFGGWMGVMVDEYGNDMREEVIRSIVYERKKRESLSSKEYNDFIQQYPLTAAEAFASNADVGLGNKIKISKQREWLLNNPIFSKKGDFRPDTNGKPKFIPNPNGRSVIYEEPQESINNLYLSGCLTPGEKVMTDTGLMNIEDVTLDNQLINEHGKLVDINTLLRYYVKDEPVYSFKMANTYRQTKFTKEHPILVSKPNARIVKDKVVRDFDFQYKRVEEIEVGDWTRVPNIYKQGNDFDITILWKNAGYRVDKHVESPLNDPDFWWFVGLWLGDGWCLNGEYKITVSMNVAETYTLERLKHLTKRLFNRSISTRTRGNCVEATFGFQQLSRFLTHHFGKTAQGKRVPEWAKRIEESLKKQLVLGYLDSDGSVCFEKRNSQYSLDFVSINLEMLESFQDILFSLGIISSITKLRDERVHIINGRANPTQKTYHIRTGHQATIDLVTMLQGNKSHKLERIDLSKNNKKSKVPIIDCYFDAKKDYIYFKIQRLEKELYTGIVYNFDCETHTFMCHHITTHNCDPVDTVTEGTKKASSHSMFIMKKANGTEAPKIVFEYTYRPEDPRDAYEQCYLALLYYNKCKVLIEKNRPGMINYFEEQGYKYLMATKPVTLKSLVARTSYDIGFHKDKYIQAYQEEIISEYIEDHYTLIPSLELLDEFNKYGMHNTDRVNAFGACLMLLKEDKTKAKSITEGKARVPNFSYKMKNGKLMYVKQ